MALFNLLPFSTIERRGRKRAQIIGVDDAKVLPKLFKSLGLAVGYTGGTYSLGFNRVNFEPAPYDFDRIIQAIDTDSYVKQAFNKYKELFWKEGWALIGDNEEAIEYLEQRIQFMELSMGMPFQAFLVETADQLCKFANSFVVKVRGDLEPYFPGTLSPTSGKKPIVGYQLLPCETVEVMRDYHNHPLKYRQNIWGAHGYSAVAGFGGAGFGRSHGNPDNLLPEWEPKEVIHFTVERKPGRIFGTPFMTAVMDDVVALRQVEEDIQNLVHRELFPLYKYIVGTELHPAEPEEIDLAANALAGLRTEGGLVLPDRHNVEVIGAEGKALQADPYLNHFKERVAIGLGLAPHHLGMSASGGNRAASERLDIALYDKIKLYQHYFAEILQLKMFDELLLEGGFDPYQPVSKNTDRCKFIFNEIDVDTQVKKENHAIQKWISDITTFHETRIAVKLRPDASEEELYSALSARMLPSPGKPIKPGEGGAPPSGASGGAKNPLNPSAQKPPSLTKGGASNTPNKPDAAQPSTGGRPNPSTGPKKGISNRSMPSNQQGRKTSPGITHNDNDWLINEVQELFPDDISED